MQLFAWISQNLSRTWLFFLSLSIASLFDRYHEIHLFTVLFVITTAGKFRTWHVENRNREGFSVCLSRSHHILSVNEAERQTDPWKCVFIGTTLITIKCKWITQAISLVAASRGGRGLGEHVDQSIQIHKDLSEHSPHWERKKRARDITNEQGGWLELPGLGLSGLSCRKPSVMQPVADVCSWKNLWKWGSKLAALAGSDTHLKTHGHVKRVRHTRANTQRPHSRCSCQKSGGYPAELSATCQKTAAHIRSSEILTPSSKTTLKYNSHQKLSFKPRVSSGSPIILY